LTSDHRFGVAARCSLAGAGHGSTEGREEAAMSSDPRVHARRWWILSVLCLSLLIITLDNTILNVALPTLVRDLHASASQLEWIVDAYVLVFAGLLLTCGSLGDRLGRKRALVTGMLVFGGFSIVAGFSHSAGQLIAARALMGIGAAIIMPSTLSILTNVFPDNERAKAIGIWAAVSGLGIPLGPVIGGWLLEQYSWGSIFFANLPIVAVTIVSGLILIPESRDPRPARLDPLGALLSIAGLAALLYAIIEAPARGWTEQRILISFVVAAVLLILFVFWERQSSHPMLDVTLFKNLRFTAASAALMLNFFALLGTTFFLTQYLQFVLGFSTLQAGVRMIPIAVGIAVAAPLSARLAERFGSKLVVACGLLVVALGVGTFSLATTDSTYGLVLIAMLIGGLGMGLSITPATDSVMGAVPKENAGVGSAMNDTTRQVGGALGVAVLGSLLSTSFSSHIADFATGLPDAQAALVRNSVGYAAQVAAQLGGAQGQSLLSSANAAFVHAMNTTALAGAAVALLGALIALAFLPARSETIEADDRAVSEARVEAATD
jgi:EmrB/QacA subfamily drug resistance transporter